MTLSKAPQYGLEARALIGRATVDLWTQGGPRWGRAFYAAAFPAVAAGVRRIYDLNPDRVAAAKDDFRRAMTEMDRELSGKPHLTGAEPKRVDIAVASLLAPMCRPPEHLVKWPGPPDALLDFVSEFEGGPTWNHVLDLYREHRAPLRSALIGERAGPGK